MARMSDLIIDIEEMLREGYSKDEVATKFGVPYEWVKEVYYAMDHYYNDGSEQFETCNFVEEE